MAQLQSNGTYRFEYTELAKAQRDSRVGGDMNRTTVFGGPAPSYEATVTEVADGIFVDEQGRKYCEFKTSAMPDFFAYVVVDANGVVLQIAKAMLKDAQ
ncbi:MAG: hypothetical protein F6K00_19610 [Leptolyngbya sp. SIOISBB]|nr:hypothetical protein [Leptolyngbya sp. SIOISBB]